MAKFKRRTRIITRTGQEHITDLWPQQVFYFLTANEYSRGMNAYLAIKRVDGTGHVMDAVVHRDEITQVIALTDKQPPAPKVVRKVRMTANGTVYYLNKHTR